MTPENDQELSNGEHIRFQLGSQAKIDAIVDMPDKNGMSLKMCDRSGWISRRKCVQ